MIISDWKLVLRVAYSVWFAFAALILLHASDLIYILFEVDTNPASWTWILTWFLIAIIVSRFIPQPKNHKWKRRAAVLIFFALVAGANVPAMAQNRPEESCTTTEEQFDDLAFDLISRWEGKRNASYQDIVGVWTICYGHTRTAGPDQYKTDEDCRTLLVEEISEYREGLHGYFNRETLDTRLPAKRDAAYSSLAFNVGIRGAGKSTATRRLNRGNIEGGCVALTWWNKAGGRVVRGLTNRRAEEKLYCLSGTGR